MKTVFLDRDGVICANRADHVKSWAEFRFLPGAVDAIVRLTRAGCRLVVITNQAVINRGQMTVEQVETIHQQMVAALARAGGRIDLVLYCPHRPEEGCACRKPQPGMLLAAAARWDIDWPSTTLVGDHWTDLQAGLRVGCRPVLVLTGRGWRTLVSPEGRRLRGYRVAPSLRHAVPQILGAGAAAPVQTSRISIGHGPQNPFAHSTLHIQKLRHALAMLARWELDTWSLMRDGTSTLLEGHSEELVVDSAAGRSNGRFHRFLHTQSTSGIRK